MKALQEVCDAFFTFAGTASIERLQHVCGVVTNMFAASNTLQA